MYIGIHRCDLMPIYDMFLMAECIRSSTSEPEERSLKIEQETTTSIITSYSSIFLNLLVQKVTGNISTNFMANQRLKERMKLIKDNAKYLESLKNYSTKQLSFSTNLQQTEKELTYFKKKCEFGENCDLFVYEFDIQEIMEYLAKESNTFNSNLSNRVQLSFVLDKANLTLMNYFAQLFVNIDIIWKLNDKMLKAISKLQLSHFHDKSPSHYFVSPTCIYIFVSITFNDPSITLYSLVIQLQPERAWQSRIQILQQTQAVLFSGRNEQVSKSRQCCQRQDRSDQLAALRILPHLSGRQ